MPRVSDFKKGVIVSAFSHGKSLNSISNEVQVPKSTVQYIVNKYKRDGNVYNKPNPGRPAKLSKRQKRQIVILSKKHSFMTARDIQMAAKLEQQVSVDTIKRVLRENKLFGRISAGKPHLSRSQLSKRKKWCTERQNLTTNDWSKVIFTDECPLYLRHRYRPYVRRNIGQRLKQKYMFGTHKHSQCLMVWGAIRFDGRRLLLRCDAKVNSIEYIRILSEGLPQIYHSRYLLQQDGAPAHRSSATTNFLVEKCVRMVPEWPSQSPDLNIIENLWAKLKYELRQASCSNVNELFAAATEIWNKIPLSMIQNLYQSLPRRMNAVVSQKGGSTKY